MASHYPYADVAEKDLYPDHWCRFIPDTGDAGTWWECSACNCAIEDSLYQKLQVDELLEFCPACGAKVIDDDQ